MDFSVVLLITALIAGIACLVASIQSKAEQTRDQNENPSGSSEYIYKRNEVSTEYGGTSLDRFYIECVLAGCDDSTINDQIIAKKVELLAQKYNLSTSSGLQRLFLQGRQEHTRIKRQKKERRIAALKIEENKEYNQSIRYSEYYGRQKRKVMLQDMAAEYRQDATSKARTAESAARAGYQKESDWAVMGGLANGIAGPAAGVAVAIDTQMRNSQIRANNQAYARAMGPAALNMMSASNNSRLYADNLEAREKETDEKLLSDLSSDEVFSLLKLSKGKISVSESGAIKVSVSVTPKNTLTIGNFPAVVDGTILSHFYEGEKEIGTAKLVIPLDGISQETTLNGICLQGAEVGKYYTVEFSPYKLWLMEK